MNMKEMNEQQAKEMDFEKIVEENERRIHYHIHKLGIHDPYNEFYTAGLTAMWQAYKTFQPGQGTLATYFNYTIRFRLLDLLRKKKRTHEKQARMMQDKRIMADSGNKVGTAKRPVIDPVELNVKDQWLWREIRKRLTDKQWKWVYYYIILEMPVKSIAAREGVTEDAVKSWGKQARKKLRDGRLWDQILD